MDTKVAPEDISTTPCGKYSVKFAFVKPGITFVTFAICFILSRAKQDLSIEKLLLVTQRPHEQGLEGIMMMYDYSRFPSSDIPKTTWAPNKGQDTSR